MGPPCLPQIFLRSKIVTTPRIYLRIPRPGVWDFFMRALVIDPCGQPQIYEETMTGSTRGIVEILRGAAEPVRINDTEVMYVNEEALMDSDCLGGFIVMEKGEDEILVMKRFLGRAVILGRGRTGRTKSTSMELLDLSRRVCVLPGKRVGPKPSLKGLP